MKIIKSNPKFGYILKKISIIIRERRLPYSLLMLPWRLLCINGLVYRHWFYKLKFINIFSKKIKIGFGPIDSVEYDLYVRKWRIDPIVNCINKLSKKYSAGIFLSERDLKNFDLLVVVKIFNGKILKKIST